MKAILLAAGYGKRLRPLTLETPKCLVEIGGISMLEFWITKLSKLGISEFLVNTHHLSDQVAGFCRNHSGRSCSIEVVHEPVLLGTAGTILHNRQFISDDVVIVHVDTYVKDSLENFITFHESTLEESKYTALGFITDTPQRFGTLELDYAKLIRGFREKDPASTSNLANAAVYIFKPAMIDWMLRVTPDAYNLSENVLTLARGIGHAYITSDWVIDIGDIESLSLCRERVSGGE